MDVGEGKVSALRVGGKDGFVLSRHSVYQQPQQRHQHFDQDEAADHGEREQQQQQQVQPLASFARGSVVTRFYQGNPALLGCLRDLVFHVLPDRDRIRFVCEIASSGLEEQEQEQEEENGEGEKVRAHVFLAVVSSSEIGSCLLILRRKRTEVEEETDSSATRVLLGIPIVPGLRIELRGRGVFGISAGTGGGGSSTRPGGGARRDSSLLYFETLSIHSMWIAIVTLERVRDEVGRRAAATAAAAYAQAGLGQGIAPSGGSIKAADDVWMQTYFTTTTSQARAVHSTSVGATASDSTDNLKDNNSNSTGGQESEDAEQQGEGGPSILINDTKKPSNAHTDTSRNGLVIWESEAGIVDRLFSHLQSASRATLVETRSSAHHPNSSTRRYVKPDVDALSQCIFEIVGSAADPDALSMGDILNALKEAFGTEVVGRQGYSGAFIDKIVYKAYGQLEPPSLIVDNLYLGSEHNAANKAQLKELGVTHVLNVTLEVEKFFPDDFTYHQVCVLDQPDVRVLPYLERALEFIDAGVQGGGCVLVHCQRGVSRSATFVVAYMMRTKGLSAEQAVQHVKERRRIVRPNRGFMQQLREFELQLQQPQ